MPNLLTKQASGHAGGASGKSGGRSPPREPCATQRDILIEPNRSTEPNTTGTEQTEPSTSLQ
eukprot:15479347-Alexandrium_andersonii.AAC.1